MKKVTVLNGITNDKFSEFEQQLKDYGECNRDEVKLDLFNLRDMDIKYCTGCWNCWVKTPGLCMHKDQMPDVLRSIIHSDLTIFLSPVIMGFVSKYIKKVNDRMIPLVHPYIGLVDNECHHFKRYEHYPKLGLVLMRDTDKDAETLQNADVEIIAGIYKRMAVNMRSSLEFSIVCNGNVEVLKNEINSI